MSNDSRYNRADSSFGFIAALVIGLGMTLGGGWLLVEGIRDLRAFPDKPRPITVAEAAAMAHPPRGTWVTLSDAIVDCVHPPHKTSGDSTYAMITDARTS